MTSLETQYKEDLEAILDRYFPKGLSEQRSDALMLFAEAMNRIRRTIVAFGGCTKCYGKGYGTQTLRATGHGEADMGDGDVHIDEPVAPVVPCTCDRGKQIEELLTADA